MNRLKKKENIVDLLVVGTGFSSLSFIDSYLKRKKKVNVVSPSLNTKRVRHDNKRNLNNHIFKILPPQMSGTEEKVKDYFFHNGIYLEQNCKLFGSLEFGGLSNYWGLQIDKNIIGDINHLSKNTQKKISKSFFELIDKFRLLGNFTHNKITINNAYFRDKFLEKNFIFENKKLAFGDPIIAFTKIKKKKIKIDEVNEETDKFIPKNFFKKYLRNKKIIFHNFAVKKILNHKKGVSILCENGSEKKIFIAKKLVLGCGTIATTKLVLDYLNIYKEVKLNHHPRLFSLYISKSRWKNKMKFQPSHFHLKEKSNPSFFTADFRPGNEIIINSLLKFKKILLPLKFLLNFLRQNMIFSNIFLHPKYGNLFLKLKKNNSLSIYSKDKNIKYTLSKVSKIIYNFLKKTKKIFPFHLNYFPGYGADFHYFGTILMGKKKELSVNENCQLHNNKRIYIVDGSVFNFKKNKYPLGLIMANSRRIGKEI